MTATKTINHASYQEKTREMSVEALRYTIKDCRETLRAWPDQPNHGYYSDEMAYCGMELRRRGFSA